MCVFVDNLQLCVFISLRRCISKMCFVAFILAMETAQMTWDGDANLVPIEKKEKKKALTSISYDKISS